MKPILSILLTAMFCAASTAQTIRTLGYNTTNGVIVANTGTNVLTFTNSVKFNTGDIETYASGLSGFGVSLNLEERRIQDANLDVDVLSWDGNEIYFGFPLNVGNTTNAAVTRANMGFSTNLNTLWTATNASNARSAIGIVWSGLTNTNAVDFYENTLTGYSEINQAIVEDPAAARADLLIPLPALTNTSNVTMMRALAGSTNTNEPWSGSVELSDGAISWLLTFTNGILTKLQEQ